MILQSVMQVSTPFGQFAKSVNQSCIACMLCFLSKNLFCGHFAFLWLQTPWQLLCIAHVPPSADSLHNPLQTLFSFWVGYPVLTVLLCMLETALLACRGMAKLLLIFSWSCPYEARRRMSHGMSCFCLAATHDICRASESWVGSLGCVMTNIEQKFKKAPNWYLWQLMQATSDRQLTTNLIKHAQTTWHDEGFVMKGLPCAAK